MVELASGGESDEERDRGRQSEGAASETADAQKRGAH